MTRQRDHDRRRLAQGWRRVPVWLDPPTLQALAQIKAALSCSEQEAIRSAIKRAGL